jgi:serine phosphatase RsbU (regulator of sigma subunit)
MFVTLFCGVIDLDTGLLTYCNCGHTDCMILRADGGLERPAATGPALAMMEGARTRAATVSLAPGDRLFLFSDGLTDAFNPAEEAFGEARLEAAAQAALAAAPDLPAATFITGLLDTATRWADTAPQFDDMTALAVTLGPR